MSEMNITVKYTNFCNKIGLKSASTQFFLKNRSNLPSFYLPQ